MSETPVQPKSVMIGSSNIYRFVEHLDKQLQDIIVMQKCTKIEVFKVLMAALEAADKRVIISAIENFLCDAVKGLKEPGEITETVKRVFTEFFDTIEETARRLPETRFAMVGPMDRPGETWYTADIEEINIEYNKRIAAINRSNVSKSGSTVRASQVFANDNVHLTIEAGKKFVETILYFAGEFFDATLMEFDDKTGEAVTMEPVGVDITDESGPLASSSREKTIENQLAEIKDVIEKRWHNDSLVMARIREEMDHMINVKKENKLILTGLVTDVVRPKDKKDEQKWLCGLVGTALDFLIPDSSKGIAFVTAGRKSEGGVPTMCEVRMKERDMSIAIRKEFAQKKKDKADLGRLFVANSVTLATRVRTDILKAIGQKCSNGKEDFFVVGFTSRPVLQIRQKDGSGQHALTFVDAITRFGGKMTRGDLQVAYGRAGTSFNGQLQQNFVVLHDKGGVQKPGVTGPTMGGGKKRANEDGDGSTGAKRADWKVRGGKSNGSVRGKK